MKAIHLFNQQIFESYEYINTDKRADIIKQATEAAQEISPKFKPTQREVDFAVCRAIEQLNFENDIRYI